MMFSQLSVILGLILFSTAVSANTRESLTLKVFDSNFRMKDNKLMTLLKRADLESHGYKKEITTEMVKEPGITKLLYRKTHFYFKVVDCSRLQEITQELQTLLPGVVGMDIVTKSNREFTTTNLIYMSQCRIGLEIHYKQDEGYSDPNNNKTRIRAKRYNTGGTCIGICICTGGKNSTHSG